MYVALLMTLTTGYSGADLNMVPIRLWRVDVEPLVGLLTKALSRQKVLVGAYLYFPPLFLH